MSRENCRRTTVQLQRDHAPATFSPSARACERSNTSALPLQSPIIRHVPATITALVQRLQVLLSEFGFQPGRFVNAIRAIPRYVSDMRAFRSQYGGPFLIRPCLHDRGEDAGESRSEYFWQDLLVARWIHDSKPQKHVDVGSRLDGFVAHVASFRELEVLDIRPLPQPIPGVHFRRIDLMSGHDMALLADEGARDGGYCDSLSCLHVLEHFGLGRYGDRIDPEGWRFGLTNLAALLRPSGKLYLATPVGRERVEFNAHRVFSPARILDVATANGLKLDRLTTFTFDAGVVETATRDMATALDRLSREPYSLAIMRFEKRDTRPL